MSAIAINKFGNPKSFKMENPCKCGANIYHEILEDGNMIRCVCNGCGNEIGTIAPEFYLNEYMENEWRETNE